MTFVQIEFVWFYLTIFVLYWSFAKYRRAQNLLLAVGSAVFYGWIHPWFLILLYSSAVLDYFCGRGMAENPSRKRLFLTLSMCGNLGMLGYFKYMDFFLENVIASFDLLGMSTSVHTLGIFLPVGISFYTFQTMSYTIDIYRGDIEPRKNFLDYVVFISFFPQLVAGPVERASNLLPQMEKPREFDLDQVRSGFGLAMWGAFKKVAIADTIAPYVDKIFMLDDPSFPLVWLGGIGFSLQILADFSGYTDIARGTARMLGINLMLNFDNPYISKSPSEFWRRWHISFSSWISDYVYRPLRGSWRGFWAFAWASTGAMLLSGLWHGASWNFVMFGAWFAVMAVVYRLGEPLIPDSIKEMRGAGLAAIALNYWITVVAMIVFREPSLARSISHFQQSPFNVSVDDWAAATVIFWVMFGLALPQLIALAMEKTGVMKQIEDSPWFLPAQTTVWMLFAMCIFSFVRVSANDFIYFQF